MRKWIDVALEEGVRFFITALGNPRWVVDKVHAVGGVVYHDVTERKWAHKALEGGVDGLICVNRPRRRPRGRASRPSALYRRARRPRRAAGLRRRRRRRSARSSTTLALGYAGVQLGTRFIATEGVRSARRLQARDRAPPVRRHRAHREDQRRPGRGDRDALHPQGRHRRPASSCDGCCATRSSSTTRACTTRSRASGSSSAPRSQGMNYNDYFQAGQSVDGIATVEPAGAVVRKFAQACARSERAA